MITPEAHHSNPHVIRGLHTEIVLANRDDELGGFLDSARGFHTLYQMQPEGLAYPIMNASIDFSCDSDTAMEVHSTIEIQLDAVQGLEDPNWHGIIANRMRGILEDNGVKIHDLSHQHLDFYVELDDMYTAHVQFTSDTESCYVSVSLVSMEKLSRASNYEIFFDADPEEVVLPARIDTLRELSKVWSLAADMTTDEFGIVNQQHQPAHRVTIAPPTKENNFNYFSSALVPYVNPDESFEPDSEHYQPSRESFSTVGGLTQAKRQLEDIAEIFRDPVAAHLYGVQGRHFVLFGPAGTGKSSLVSALAVELDAELKTVLSSDIVDKWVGNSAKNVAKLFDDLMERPRTDRILVFFEEFEAIGSKGRSGTQERVDLKKQLNIGIDAITRDYPNIIIAGATNADIDDLEPALVRSGRLEPIGAPLPNEEERVDVWSAVLTSSIVTFNRDRDPNGADPVPFIPYEDDINPVELAHVTDGMTGADFTLML